MNAEPQRLFIAVPINEQWRKLLSEQRTLLQSKLSFQKWTHPDDYHITLKFLGDTSAAQLQQILKILTNVAKTTIPFELTEKDWGTFGPQTAPNILWAGVGGDLDSLNILQKKVDQLDNLGFPAEKRIFHPHLTIARRYNGNLSLTSSIKQYLPNSDEPYIHCSINEIKIFRSHLRKQPMYEPIATFKLNN
jgi:2'-5' RNA ligase